MGPFELGMTDHRRRLDFVLVPQIAGSSPPLPRRRGTPAWCPRRQDNRRVACLDPPRMSRRVRKLNRFSRSGLARLDARPCHRLEGRGFCPELRMTAIIDIVAPRNPRQPRQSDRRGRRDARRRRAGPRRGAVGRLDRRARGASSCATATRSATAARACRSAVEAVNGEIFDAICGMDARGPDPDRQHADRARRHAEQGAARRQRDPRRVAGASPRPPPMRPACRCIAISAAPARACCRCR